MNKFFSFLLISIASCILLGCSLGKKTEKKFKIGFSQCTGSDNWRKSMLQAMQRELSFYPGTELIYRDANDNSDLQVKQVRELVEENIDILLLSPNEAQPLTPIVEEVFTKGIPVVIIDRKTASNLYTSFIGADNYEIGRIAAHYVGNILNGKGNVIQIIGLAGSTPAIERQKGFSEGLKNYPDVKIIAELYGNWQKEKASAVVKKNEDKLENTDLVFAHNDLMALGAYEIYKQSKVGRQIKFIGVDGLSGPGGGIEFVSNKILNATLLYPTGGEEAIQTAMQILNKQSFEKENQLQTLVIDSSNVRLMKLQTDKINSQQNDIEKQNALLSQQTKIYNDQRVMLNAAVIALLLILLLGSISFYSWRNNRKINKRLATQNEEILSQKNQLVEMSAIAKEATEAKLNFFTNISHEFRTPLSLILGPLENILKNPKVQTSVKQNLELVNKNVLRLLRLVNQLMDFRKIEHDKMKLRASQNNLGDFVSEVVNAFKGLAQRKFITLNINIREKDLNVWFDPQMLDKVLFNIFSNAFKFTGEQGSIKISVDKSGDHRMAIIKIEDTGIGMTPETVEHAFDLFYQSSEVNSNGYGIGLALSKQLISLHHGDIKIKSERWVGTTFEIQLPLGNSHLSEDEIIDDVVREAINYDDIRIYSADVEPVSSETISSDETVISKTKEHSILLIEDNHELRTFLKTSLQNNYEIFEADNGISGSNTAYDIVPDLIICDIILPGNSGLNITETLKNDIRTSHIPIIILTAKVGMEHQIESLRLKADAFITKPFNLEYLEENIKNLLRNREALKEHYISELPTDIRIGSFKKIERKFINEFTAIVENNLANENFSVEDICREIGISRVQLYRKLKALVGVNVSDYILSVRLQKAKHLLKEELNISEVAFKVGFSSQAYFSTVFKSKFSCTPTEYKEKFRLPKSI